MKIAMIQTGNHWQNQALGFERAANLVAAAARDGAQMAVLPELQPAGYVPSQRAWQLAEPEDGRTLRWAKALAIKHSLYVGAGFTQLDGEDFYNAYLMVDPGGKLLGIIHKETVEVYSFKGAGPGHVYVNTDFGRLGIGICVDNHFAGRLRLMAAAKVKLMLMPHAAPCPFEMGGGISQADFDGLVAMPKRTARAYAQYLGVPVLYVNPVGTTDKWPGGLAMKTYNEKFRLMGGSVAVDATGKVLAEMGQKEGYCVVEIDISGSQGLGPFPMVYNKKWLHPGNGFFRTVVAPLAARKGEKSYERNHTQAARTMQGQ